MAKAKFSVFGALDFAGGHQRGTVTIDRETGEFAVRPHKRRKRYSLPLSAVATMVCRMLIAHELREKKKAKLAKRKS